MSEVTLLDTIDAKAGSPLLCGVPFGQGAASRGTGFNLRDQAGGSLPLWWEERSHWPDGSEHEIRIQWDVDDGFRLDRIRPPCLSSSHCEFALHTLPATISQSITASA